MIENEDLFNLLAINEESINRANKAFEDFLERFKDLIEYEDWPMLFALAFKEGYLYQLVLTLGPDCELYSSVSDLTEMYLKQEYNKVISYSNTLLHYSRTEQFVERVWSVYHHELASTISTEVAEATVNYIEKTLKLPYIVVSKKCIRYYPELDTALIK